MTRGGLALTLSAAPSLDKLQLVRLSGEEALGELFVFQLELQSSDTALDFSSMVGQPITASLALADGQWRHFSGLVARFLQTGGGLGSTTCHAELRPWFWWLSLEVDSRIFQQQSVPEIITGLFREFSYTDFRDSLSRSYPPREYCVQYGESAYAFISRLMEEEGIYYCFEHGKSGHTLVLLDGGEAYAPCQGLTQAVCMGMGSSRERMDLVYRCDAEQSAVAARYASGDFNFMTPAAPLAASAGGDTGRRVYEYPGGYADGDAGQVLALRRMQALGLAEKAIRGDSSCRAFTAGCRFTLAGHARAELNAEHVLRHVAHSASHEGYSNSFTAFPLAVPFRSPQRTPKTRIPGTQTATVVGKAGEEIWTDSHGRIKIQFHWDRLGKSDENSSCWVRVAQGWAGQGWGMFFLPRVGQEVIVSFLDGDPDRPLVTGSVYNAAQTVPEALPARQTRSVIRGQSSKGGGGGNELRFEDLKDSEELYLHAQKDMITGVENDRSTTVVKGNDSLLVQQGTRTVDVKGDETHTNHAAFSQTVTGNFTLKVDGNLSIEVGGSISIKAGSTLSSEAGTSLSNKAGTSLSNEAGTTLSSKASATQTLDGGGMLELKGGIVKIN